MTCRRRVLLFLLALGLYLLLAPGRRTASFSGTLRKARPLAVWEFVMDFNNLKLLNPTILDFWLVGDEGGGTEWHYQIGYTEFLHQMPFIKNQAIGEFHCIPLGEDNYVIKSKHRTCFFTNFTCVTSLSEFTFQVSKENAEDTFCKETVQYECPWLLSSFCFNEVMFQRKAIFENLDIFFTRDK